MFANTAAPSGYIVALEAELVKAGWTPAAIAAHVDGVITRARELVLQADCPDGHHCPADLVAQNHQVTTYINGELITDPEFNTWLTETLASQDPPEPVDDFDPTAAYLEFAREFC